MKLAHRLLPGAKVSLHKYDPDDSGPFKSKTDPHIKKEFDQHMEKLNALQDALLGEGQRALLVVLQAMDTGGKDGVLRRVFGPLDSRAMSVATFKAPNSEELAHDYLRRAHLRTPARGQIVVFNRSHYEDVLAVRVLELVPKAVWKRRYDHINAFEQMLSDEGTQVVKFFLHISRDEQKKRLQERLDDPSKNWKFDNADLKARAQWDDYVTAYEEALARTSTETAPWYIVPANRKWFRDLAIIQVLVQTLESMDPKYPKPTIDVKKVVIPD